MSRSLTWFVAILGLALIWVAAVHDRLPAIEREIGAGARAALAARGLDRRFDGLAIAIDGRDVSVSGAALTELDRQAALEALARVPGVRHVIDRTSLVPEARPFRLRIARDASGRVRLSGAVPDAEARARLGELAGAGLADETRLSRGRPPGDWPAAAALAVEMTLRLVEGEAVLADRVLEVRGRASDDETIEAIEAALKRRLPEGFHATATLDAALDAVLRGAPLADADACAALFAKVLAARAIEFEAGTALLTPANRRTLQRLVVVGRRCAGLTLAIRAHVAARDEPAAAQRLADSRALAVLRYLAGAGIERARLVAEGVVGAEPGAERIELQVRAEAIRGGGVVAPAAARVLLAARLAQRFRR
jgi:OOP family OmpA-OmpF porin